MDYNKLKLKAVDYAKEFLKTGDIRLNLSENLNNKEWYIVVRLSQVYYNLMVKTITRDEAKKEQAEIFNFVKENKHYFEE